MVLAWQQNNIQPMNREDRAQRAVVAFMAYNTGFLQDYGFTRDYVDTRANNAIEQYVNSENIPRQRAISCMSFDSYFSEIGTEAICMDRGVLQRALHLPLPNSSESANIPSPLTIQVGQAGLASSDVVTFADYSDFRNAALD